MAKTFRVLIQGIDDPIEVEGNGFNQIAAIIPQQPARFSLSRARADGVVGIENIETGKAAFYRIAATRTVLYPISPKAAAACMMMAA